MRLLPDLDAGPAVRELRRAEDTAGTIGQTGLPRKQDNAGLTVTNYQDPLYIALRRADLGWRAGYLAVGRRVMIDYEPPHIVTVHRIVRETGMLWVHWNPDDPAASWPIYPDEVLVLN